MESNYERKLSVEDIADAFCVSVPYLYRVLRDEARLSPVHFMNEIRVRKAEELLKSTTMPVAVVAERCGFDSVRVLYRAFKKHFLCTPTEYRSRIGIDTS
jgi:transcriptional regulator GlxA family with amidase domain